MFYALCQDPQQVIALANPVRLTSSDHCSAPSSSSAQNPGEWSLGLGSAQPIACDGPEGRPRRGDRELDNRERGRRRSTIRYPVRRMALLDQWHFPGLGRRGRAGRASPEAEPGAGSAGRGAAQRRRLDRLWKAKRDAGYSSNSVRIMRTVLRRALGQAVREGIVARNVAGLSAAPRIRAKDGRTLTVDQARQLLEAAAGYRFEAAVVLALAYAMRRGEVLGLHWSALDWKAGTLGVTHGVKRVKDRDVSSGRRTRLVVSELKTPKSRRTLSLTPEMVARFRQHRVRQAEAQMAAGPLWQDHGLIFASEVGTPMDPDGFSHSFARLCERAGLGHWHPHELRHSGASLMLAQGTPLHVVSEVLGHASIAITKDVYGHLLEGDKRAAAESMSRALFGG